MQEFAPARLYCRLALCAPGNPSVRAPGIFRLLGVVHIFWVFA